MINMNSLVSFLNASLEPLRDKSTFFVGACADVYLK